MISIRIAIPLSLALWVFTGGLRAAEMPATFKVSEFTFKRPSGWTWIEPTSTMRKAEFRVEGPKGKAEVIFFNFGAGQGGGVQANVDRWFGQFQEPRDKINAKVEDKTVGKRKVTYVQAQGTYMSGVPGGDRMPMKDHALLGAIIESAEGSVFVRMTGPTEVVKGADGDFRKMIESGLQ